MRDNSKGYDWYFTVPFDLKGEIYTLKKKKKIVRGKKTRQV